MQKEEVADVKWATIEEIRALIKSKEFSDSHAEFFSVLYRIYKGN